MRSGTNASSQSAIGGEVTDNRSGVSCAASSSAALSAICDCPSNIAEYTTKCRSCAR